MPSRKDKSKTVTNEGKTEHRGRTREQKAGNTKNLHVEKAKER